MSDRDYVKALQDGQGAGALGLGILVERFEQLDGLGLQRGVFRVQQRHVEHRTTHGLQL